MQDKIDRVFVDGYGVPVVLRGVNEESVVIENRFGFTMMSVASFVERYEELAC